LKSPAEFTRKPKKIPSDRDVIVAVIECMMSRCVWALADPTVVEYISLMTEPSAKQWLFSMINSMKHEEFTRMVVTMWAIWHVRRKFIHEEIHQYPLATHQFVERFFHDMGVAHLVTKKEGAVACMSERAPSWSPPPEDACKINADDIVAKVSNKGAVGMVCRSREGHYLGASVLVFDGVTHPGCLEALACREAMDLQVREVMVASDCLEVIQGIQGKSLGQYSHILQEIQAMSRLRGGVSFRHEQRNLNEEAHKLARLGTTLHTGRHV
jgi:hypothetical protein